MNKVVELKFPSSIVANINNILLYFQYIVRFSTPQFYRPKNHNTLSGMGIYRYIITISQGGGKYQLGHEIFNFLDFLLISKKKSKGLRTKVLLNVTFAYKNSRGRVLL
jgi:hypothetical protein